MWRKATTFLGTLAVIAAPLAPCLPPPPAAPLPPGPWDPYFAAPSAAADFGSAKPYGVAAGDFTGDGKADLVVGVSRGGTTGLTFSAPTTVKDYSSVTGRPFGIAPGDFDRDGKVDLVVARTTASGTVDFFKGNGDGTFAAPVAFAWRLEGANAYGLAAGDVNGDGWPDLVFGATVAGTDGVNTIVNDGDVRVLYNTYAGTVAGMFAAGTYARSGITFAAGTLMSRIATSGIDVGSVTVADVDGNGYADAIAGGLDGAGNTIVRVIKTNAGTPPTFTLDTTSLVSQPTSVTTATSPIIYPAVNPAVSPWGLAVTDMNNDGKPDLLVGDRNMYAYLFLNGVNGDPAGKFTLQTGFTVAAGRPTVFRAYARDALGTTGSMAAADLSGDGRPDIVVGTETGSQTASAGANDGNVVADVSTGLSGYTTGLLANGGFEARGVNLVDVNGDGRLDVVWATFGGKLDVITQQAPVAPDPDVYLLTGNGDGTFAAPVAYDWRLEAGNTSAFAAGDLNHDGKLDLVFGATADGVSGGTARVATGDVRVLYGNGDGTFALNSYDRLGTTYAAGALVGHVGASVSSLTVGDLDKDGWPDVVAGGLNSAATNALIEVVHNNADGTFTPSASPLVSEPIGDGTAQTPIYWPPLAPNTTPWGLALGDVTGDGAAELFIADRSQYVYRYDNDGTGSFAMHTPNSTVISGTRPNVYFLLTASPPTGYTASLAAGDLNGDGKADLAIGLYSGTNTPATNLAGDGTIHLALSDGDSYRNAGSVADIGTQARELAVFDADSDGAMDIAGGQYGGTVAVLRQLTPKDSDADGISDYVDNAPYDANAPRLDMNSDGSINRTDQLDNDNDTVLGDPQDPSTWQRLGDAADADDDNDGVLDVSDNCPLVANADQADRDGDGTGDACDPLDNRDPDGDGVPNSILPGDPLYAQAQAAAAKWASASQHFVIRIDALGRWWQSEFTQTLSDGAIQSDEAAFQAACLANYTNGHNGLAAPDYAAMTGGKNLPVTLATIPKMVWTDPAVVNWINARIDDPNLEIAQHGTYHVDNVPNGDDAWWKDLPTSDIRHWTTCETCGLTVPENFELLKVGRDTLLGNYGNKSIADTTPAPGPSAPKIDWTGAAHPLLTYVAPYDTSDTLSREAMAQLGFRAFSASSYEESGVLAPYLSPEGSHMNAFDQYGMYHASAYQQVSPGDVNNLQHIVDTEGGNLHVWLIEEVDWSGHDGTGAVNDQVDMSTWPQWLQLLDFVKNYPDSVAMTAGEVALAKAFDNAPTVSNPDQADSNHNGIGDVVDGATLTPASASLVRDQSGQLSATLMNGSDAPIAGQQVVFHYDADGNGTPEDYAGTTGIDGVATVDVTPTQAPGSASFGADWDGVVTSATTSTGVATVTEHSLLTLAATNPTSAQVGDPVTLSATLTSSHGDPLAGRSVTFAIGTTTATVTTGSDGVGSTTLTAPSAGGNYSVSASFTGDSTYLGSSDSSSLTVTKKSTTLTLDSTVPTAGDITDPVTVGATLTDNLGHPVVGATVTLAVGGLSVNATTSATGHASATMTLAPPSGATTVSASFAGTSAYTSASASKGFTVNKEATTIVAPATASNKAKGAKISIRVRLIETDNGVQKGVAGRTLRAYSGTSQTVLDTETTDSQGYVTFSVTAPKSGTLSVQSRFAGDTSYLASLGTTVISR
jgi:hypothetical protein